MDNLFNQMPLHPDGAEMPPGHRMRFSKKLDENFHLENKLWNLQRYLIVASVIIFLGISLLVLISIGDFHSSKAVFAVDTPELYETEIFLRAEIDNRLIQLSTNKHVNKQIIADINQIDGSIRQIQSDLHQNPGDDRLIRAVIESYQTKIELLDRIISQIEFFETKN